jgi:hypothetical protein
MQPSSSMKENFVKMVNDLSPEITGNIMSHQNYGLIPPDLLKILQKEFHLSTELCLDELHMSEGFEHHSYINSSLQLHNQKQNFLGNLSNTFVNIPSNAMCTLNHQRIHTTEVILINLEKILKNDNPVRCVLTLFENNSNKRFMEQALSIGAKLFLEIPKGQESLIHPLAYKFEQPPKIRSNKNLTFLLFQNKNAETSIPFAYKQFKSQIMEWCLENKIQNYTLTPLMSSTLTWNLNLQSFSLEQDCPIATYNRNVHSLQNLQLFTSKEKAMGIDKINQSAKDKSILFSGFFPKTFHSMIKNYRPKSYKEDLHQIRFELLEENSKVFDWYVNINKWSYKALGDKETKTRKKRKLANIITDNNEKICKKRKLVNVHSMYQDRKKKHKKS